MLGQLNDTADLTYTAIWSYISTLPVVTSIIINTVLQHSFFKMKLFMIIIIIIIITIILIIINIYREQNTKVSKRYTEKTYLLQLTLLLTLQHNEREDKIKDESFELCFDLELTNRILSNFSITNISDLNFPDNCHFSLFLQLLKIIYRHSCKGKFSTNRS